MGHFKPATVTHKGMWRIVDKRVSARRDPRYGQAFKRQLGRAVNASLAADQKRRVDEAGSEVEALVKADPPLIHEAWYRIHGWYKAAVNRTLPPSRVTLEQITAERVALYRRVPPPGENIPVQIEPFEVEDKVPEEGEIEWEAKRLHNNRSGEGVADAGGAPQGMASGGKERRDGRDRGHGGGRPGEHKGGG